LRCLRPTTSLLSESNWSPHQDKPANRAGEPFFIATGEKALAVSRRQGLHDFQGKRLDNSKHAYIMCA
jgi:hypothetical protein